MADNYGNISGILMLFAKFLNLSKLLVMVRPQSRQIYQEVAHLYRDLQ